MTTIPIYRPYVFLRCNSCGRKTDHVLINIVDISEKGEIKETYECQACGKTKTIYEFAESHVHGPMYSIDTELKELQGKEPLEVAIDTTTLDTQQPHTIKIKKKKRKLF